MVEETKPDAPAATQEMAENAMVKTGGPESAVAAAQSTVAENDILGENLPNFSEMQIEKLLDEKRCYSCNLSGVDLKGKNLRKADLEGADLSGVNFESVDLEGANLKGVSLKGANMKNADLRKADLYKANLSGADLTGADLEGAQLDEADLTGTIGYQPSLMIE